MQFLLDRQSPPKFRNRCRTDRASTLAVWRHIREREIRERFAIHVIDFVSSFRVIIDGFVIHFETVYTTPPDQEINSDAHADLVGKDISALLPSPFPRLRSSLVRALNSSATTLRNPSSW